MSIMINDIFIEFLEVSIHQLLYLTNIYPKEIFESRKKYGAPVKYSLHPEVNSYITNCLKSAKILLEGGDLDKVVFCILNEDKSEHSRFVFAVDRSDDVTARDPDHYLIQCEQNLRAFCLKLGNSNYFSRPLPEDCSFAILLHTAESAAIKLSRTPEMEHFPCIEKEKPDEVKEMQYYITPIHSIQVDNSMIQTYIEHQKY